MADDAKPKLPALTAGGQVKAIVPQSFEDMYRVARITYSSGMVPRGYKTVESVMVAMMHGAEVGLTPMMALQTIGVINGMPVIYGDGAVALIEAAGVLDDMDEHFEGKPYDDDYKAVCIVRRVGRKRVVTSEFSVLDAKEAGLWDNRKTVRRQIKGEWREVDNDAPWFRYKKRMLKMRARGFALRDAFADILKGLRLREEVEDYAQGDDGVYRQTDAGTAPSAEDVSLMPPAPPPEAEADSSGPVMGEAPADIEDAEIVEDDGDLGPPPPPPDEGAVDGINVNDLPEAPPLDPEAFLKGLDKSLGEMTADDESVNDTIQTIIDMVADKVETGELLPPDGQAAMRIIERHAKLLGVTLE